MNLKGKVAIVTGGTGLAKEIALQLAHNGCDVAIIYSRSVKEAEETSAELRKLNVRSSTFRADISVAADVNAMVADVARTFGRLDIVICNAATTVFKQFSDIDGVTEADFDRIYNTNVKGTWLTIKAAVPYLRKQGGGRIVTISSVAGLRPAGSSLPYSVSKAAVIHLTKGLAVGLGADKILVNSVAPGLLETRWIAGFPAEQKEAMRNRSVLNKVASLADTAAAVLLLVQSDSITGETIVVDAGSSLL